MGTVVDRLRRLATGRQPAPHCGWCGRTTADQVRLLSGPRVYLCAVCVRDAARHERGTDAVHARAVGCQFCGRIRPALRPAGPDITQVCSACVALLDAIPAEHDVLQSSAT